MSIDPKTAYWMGALINMAVIVSLLYAGARAIRRRRVRRHKRLMLSAASLVGLFSRLLRREARVPGTRAVGVLVSHGRLGAPLPRGLHCVHGARRSSGNHPGLQAGPARSASPRIRCCADPPSPSSGMDRHHGREPGYPGCRLGASGDARALALAPSLVLDGADQLLRFHQRYRLAQASEQELPAALVPSLRPGAVE